MLCTGMAPYGITSIPNQKVGEGSTPHDCIHVTAFAICWADRQTDRQTDSRCVINCTTCCEEVSPNPQQLWYASEMLSLVLGQQELLCRAMKKVLQTISL